MASMCLNGVNKTKSKRSSSVRKGDIEIMEIRG